MILPNKYKAPGLYVFCNTCKKTVSHGRCAKQSTMCSHIFQSRIWNPRVKRTNIIKSWGKISASEAFKRHLDFRKELESRDYFYNPPAVEKVEKALSLTDAKNRYLDYLKDIGVPEHEKRFRSKRHISDQTTFICRFFDVIKSKGVNPSNTHPQISSEYVGWFHSWLTDKGYANKTYNHHVESLRWMFSWLESKGYIEYNAFKDIKTKFTSSDPEIILEEEFTTLISVISYENGWSQVGKQQKNHYRDWLIAAIKLGLYTGERRDGIVLLKAKHIEGNYIKIPNWKRNRAQGVEDYSYVPITSDMAEFLASFDLSDPESYLIAPYAENRNTIKEQVSKSFAHFWKRTGIKKDVSFKNLRKTFETRMYMLLGEKVKGLKRHKSMSVKIDHYLSQKAITEELIEKRLFDI